jgi:hypothetical protein
MKELMKWRRDPKVVKEGAHEVEERAQGGQGRSS